MGSQPSLPCNAASQPAPRRAWESFVMQILLPVYLPPWDFFPLFYMVDPVVRQLKKKLSDNRSILN